MPVQALAKSVKLSPRKVAVVASLVKGRSVSDALVILENTPRRSSLAVSKVIKSAAANATHNHGYKSEGLKIIEISATQASRLRRYRPASRGRALPYTKESTFIKVVVEGEKRPPKKESESKTTKEKAKE